MFDNNKLLELNDEERNKIKMLEEEKNKIMENYMPIKDEYDISTRLLLQYYEIMDKFKFEVEKCEIEKINQKKQMHDYLFTIEQKKDELIRKLCEQLKLSVNFKKNNNF